MSHRFARFCGAACLLVALPVVSQAQNKNCCCKTSSTARTSYGPSQPRIPTFSMSSNPSRPSFQNPISPNSPWLPNVRKGGPPQVSLSRQQDPNFQQALTNNLLMQQTMLNEQLHQYRMQDMVKQQLLRYAIDAPTENLQRELKNSNAFVRWAASVELNRRWNAEKPVAVARAKAEPPPAARLALEFTQTVRAETPARVTTSNDQTLLLQFGLPK